VPSEDMGDYEEYRKKKPARKSGPLYPLNEEGSYGAPPAPPPKPLPGYQKRERKPKVYSGYAVSSDCSMHADKLHQNEEMSRTQGSFKRRTPSFSRPAARPAPARRASTLPRNHGVRGPSPAPSLDAGRPVDWKNSLRGSSVSREEPRPRVKRPSPRREPEPPRRPRSPTPEKERSRRSLSSDGQSPASSSSGSTDWGYTSYSSFLNGTSRTSTGRSSTSQSSYRKSSMGSSFKETDEYDRGGKVSLDALKTPEISPWDNMGILGLTSKMYSDTSVTKQQSFSASSFVRKESVSSHAM